MPRPLIVSLVVGSFYNYTSHHNRQLELGTAVLEITTRVFTRIIPRMCLLANIQLKRERVLRPWLVVSFACVTPLGIGVGIGVGRAAQIMPVTLWAHVSSAKRHRIMRRVPACYVVHHTSPAYLELNNII